MNAFERELLSLIVEALLLPDVDLDSHPPEGHLFEELDLDSIDALEIAMVIKRAYGVEFTAGDDDNRAIFTSLRSLAAYVDARREAVVLGPREQIFVKIRDTLSEMFEIDPGEITLDVHLFEDLDLDSIDALDMAVKLQEFTGTRVPEKSLMEVRRVRDVVDLVESLMTQPADVPV